MTPAARIAAAADILDEIGPDGKAETTLKTWAREHRFAGSKDRAAIRDHVFDVLRAKRSLGALGGGQTGRALMLGLLRRQGADIGALFSGNGYGPTQLAPHEQDALAHVPDLSPAQQADIPDWLWPIWVGDLGEQAVEIGIVLQSRAPISLRVNLRRGSVGSAQAALAEDGVQTRTVADVKTALQVTEKERRIKVSEVFLDGYVELQDIASQKAVAGFTLPENATVLDYCAGGGGKALAFADMYDVTVIAHDIAAKRMVDLPLRAARAGVEIETLTTGELSKVGPCDLVFCDAPCSGSGTWRRTPDAKWQLSEELLFKYNALQDDALANAARYVAQDGTLVYATCSLLRCENDDRITAFLSAHADWVLEAQWQLRPTSEHDGFFRAILKRTS